MKVVVSGGGTGGHILPVLAVINSLNKLTDNSKIIFIGSRFGMESKLIPKMGIKYYGVSVGKFRRYHSSKILNIIDPTTLYYNAKDFFGFFGGIFDARKILKYEKPNVVFAKGGFVSLPVGIAAWSLKIPLVIHESDSIMGLANKLMSKISMKVCTAFPIKSFKEIVDEKKLIETGNPIRNDVLFGMGDRFLSEQGLDKNKKTLLIIGGSQGSQFINEMIMEIIPEIYSKIQILWIAGEQDSQVINYRLENHENQEIKKSIRVFGFVSSEMGDVYNASDLVISRAGSNVLFELAALGKPAILIPLEIAGGHQVENAKIFSRSGAAYVMRQTGLTPKKIIHQIDFLLNNPDELKSLSEGMIKMSNLHASDQVAKIIIESGQNKKSNE